MKKIDLHLHTQKCKKGDGKKREISTEDFIKTMHKYKIGVCSITNHNKFDIHEYNYIKDNADFLIFPGIELDVLFLNKKAKHIILICNPKCDQKFYDIFSKDEKRNYDSYFIEYNNFISSIKRFNKNEIIIIPHFLDKDKEKSLTNEEKDELKKDLKNYIIILEPKLRTMGIINAHDEISLIGSDVKNWDKYDEDVKKLPEIKFMFDSFGKFYELASNPNVFIKTCLNDCEKKQIKIDNDFDNIDIYKDINVIFGGKGSGKTFLINIIYKQLQSSLGGKIIFHKGTDYERKYQEILSDFENKVEINNELKDKIINTFDEILDFKETNKTNFIEKYVAYFNKQDVSNKAKKIKKTDSVYNKNSNETIKEICDKLNGKFQAIQKVNSINEVRDDTNIHKELLSKELKILKEELFEELLKNANEIFSISKTNTMIDNIKSIISKKTGKISKPNNIGFSKMVSERKSFFEKIKNLRNNLTNIETSKIMLIGNLPEKGDIFLKVIIEVLKKDTKHSKGSPFDKSKINNNRDFITKITNFSINDLLKINSFFSDIDTEKKGKEYFEDCVKKYRLIFRENGGEELYEPSEGEKSILSISGYLEDTSIDCFLFDEIERGLGNKYISEYIIPKLKSLRDSGKTIVLSTHNANIAINTLPTQTIYCNYLGQKYDDIYYTGNMYENKLKSVKKGSSDEKKWENVAIEHLEGSEQMFNVRRNIWIQEL